VREKGREGGREVEGGRGKGQGHHMMDNGGLNSRSLQ